MERLGVGNKRMREFSPIAIILGVVIGALLAAANAFVGLKVGMTISASIPAAVMSLLILRTLLKRGTLLESNMVQTIGSAGESVAAGMIFTIPALFIMGEKPEYLEMIIWGGIGGLLGVCFMVPLRQILIVKEHGKLPYPEGVACAEVLQSGERGGSGARSVIVGAIVGAAYYFITGLGFWQETGRISLRRFRTEFQLESSPALLGVGYILGARIAAYMLAGAILSWFILIPAVGFFGAASTQPIFPAATQTIANMTPGEIYDNYVRYIGAGAVAIGGLISLFKSFPTIISSFWHIISGLFRRREGAVERTDRDIPFPLLIAIIAGLAFAMWKFEQVRIDHIGVIAVVVFTFFFVTVSSRLVGIVGSSSNPVSGMTIATLLATALIYRFFVMGDGTDFSAEELTGLKIACLSVGAIVCIAISVGGDTSQDLKTGFLLKATPWKQQAGEMIGVITSVIVIAGLLLLLDKTYGFTPDRADPLPAYQANIMKILVEGVLGGEVPWTLIMMGGAAAVIVEMLGLPALPFAVGMYLPLGLSTPIMVGGLVRWHIQRKQKEASDHDAGVLTSSGLVAGMGLMGVTFAGVLALISWIGGNPQWTNPLSGKSEGVSYAHVIPWMWDKIELLPLKWGLSDGWWDALPLFPFFIMTGWLWWSARQRPPSSEETPSSPSSLPLPLSPIPDPSSPPVSPALTPTPPPPPSLQPFSSTENWPTRMPPTSKPTDLDFENLLAGSSSFSPVEPSLSDSVSSDDPETTFGLDSDLDQSSTDDYHVVVADPDKENATDSASQEPADPTTPAQPIPLEGFPKKPPSGVGPKYRATPASSDKPPPDPIKAADIMESIRKSGLPPIPRLDSVHKILADAAAKPVEEPFAPDATGEEKTDTSDTDMGALDSADTPELPDDEDSLTPLGEIETAEDKLSLGTPAVDNFDQLGDADAVSNEEFDSLLGSDFTSEGSPDPGTPPDMNDLLEDRDEDSQGSS